MRTCAIAAVLALLPTFPGQVLAQEIATQTQTERTVVRSEADLPAYSYALSMKPSELMHDEAAFAEFAGQVRANLTTLLTRYDIRDKVTLAGIHATLRDIALLRGDTDTALAQARTSRELLEKPADRLLAGLQHDATVAALRAGDDAQARRTAYRLHLDTALSTLPWATVQTGVREMKRMEQMQSGNVFEGLVVSVIDPTYEQSGAIGQTLASRLIGWQAQRVHMLPYAGESIAALDAYIDANVVDKPDIWPARNVSLDGRTDLTPVVIAIWDTGVDTGLFPGRLHVNPGEQANGLDDDDNGFIDDIHGIAHDLESNKVTELLLPLTAEQRAYEPTFRRFGKGIDDMAIGIDSEEARQVREHISGLSPQEFRSFLARGKPLTHYSHGTHVAGIAVDGNPAARLLTVRQTWPQTFIEPPYTRERAQRKAGEFREVVTYLKAQGVRVVNTSWGTTPAEIERTLEVNNLGGDPEQRRQEALAIWTIVFDAFSEATHDAAEILFVSSAGNSDDDLGFQRMFPGGIEAPNLLTVGAVDHAGDETSFTSHGRLVRVHANGYEVEGLVPGGGTSRGSGTSWAAPQVANLAAKLLAIEPALTVNEVIALVLDGAERSADGRRNLINPKRSVALLAERFEKSVTTGH